MTKIALFLILAFMAHSEVKIYTSSDQTYYDLSGYDGLDGQDGAACQSGEDGQDGEDGDDVVIFYNKTRELKRITLNLSGGFGGEGGVKGERRDCPHRYLTDGRPGRRGSYGRIKLVEGITELPTEISSVKVPVSQIKATVFTFTKNHWISKDRGASDLFKKDSNILDSYQVFYKSEKTSFIANLDSLDESDLNNIDQVRFIHSPFSERKIKLEFYKEDKKVKALVDYDVKAYGDVYELVMNNVYFEDEIMSTKVIDVIGAKDKTMMIVEDPSLSLGDVTLMMYITLYKYSSFVNHYIIQDSVAFGPNDYSIKDDLMMINIGEKKHFKKQFNNGDKYKAVISVRKNVKQDNLSYHFDHYFDIKPTPLNK